MAGFLHSACHGQRTQASEGTSALRLDIRLMATLVERLWTRGGEGKCQDGSAELPE